MFLLIYTQKPCQTIKKNRNFVKKIGKIKCSTERIGTKKRGLFVPVKFFCSVAGVIDEP